jgi:nucleolar protein 12
LTTEEENRKNERTIFVGNVPLETKAEKLQKFFSSFGKVESVRFRSVAVTGVPLEKYNQKALKKVSAIKGAFNTEAKSSKNAYVVFVEAESVSKAVKEANGVIFNGVHLRVDSANRRASVKDATKSVFLGNLPLKVNEEDLWKFFGSKLPDAGVSIDNIRVVRDNKKNIGKGFGYINFKDEMSVPSALALNDIEYGEGDAKRKIRITKCKKNLMNKSVNSGITPTSVMQIKSFSGEISKAPKGQVQINKLRKKIKGKSSPGNSGVSGGKNMSNSMRKKKGEKKQVQKVAKRLKMGEKKKIKDRV